LALPLPLRNGLAGLILEAFDREESRRALDALAAVDDEGWVPAAGPARDALDALPWFAAGPGRRRRLAGSWRPHAPELRRRARAARGALSAAPAGLLARAEALAGAGLYFEVHELLEPAWLRAEGDARTLLQGLIQTAVGLHHAQEGNARGARSLLAQGLGRLAAGSGAGPAEAGAWRRRGEAALARLEDGWAAAPAPGAGAAPAGRLAGEGPWRSC
jgi:hypothetical protein